MRAPLTMEKVKAGVGMLRCCFVFAVLVGAKTNRLKRMKVVEAYKVMQNTQLSTAEESTHERREHKQHLAVKGALKTIVFTVE